MPDDTQMRKVHITCDVESRRTESGEEVIAGYSFSCPELSLHGYTSSHELNLAIVAALLKKRSEKTLKPKKSP